QVENAAWAEPDLEPFLKPAIEASANPEAFAFLNETDAADHRMLRAQYYPQGGRSLDRLRRKPFWDTYLRTTRIVGVMGEIYLNTYVRKWVRNRPGSQFVTSPE